MRNGVSNHRGRFGGRHVQVSIHDGDPSQKGWGPFQLVDVNGFAGQRGVDNVYFAAVNVIPHTKYLLGLFPLATRKKRIRRHVVAAAFSCDGVHFSRFLDFAEAGDAGAGRTFAQPIDSLVVEEGLIHVYVQENVLGLAMDRYEDDPLFPTGPPRVVRYGTQIADLIQTAEAETRGLAGCSAGDAAFAARAAAPPTETREEKRARRKARRSEDSTPEPRPAGGNPAPPDTTRPPPSDKTAPRSSRRAVPVLLAAVLAFVVFRCCELAFLLYL